MNCPWLSLNARALLLARMAYVLLLVAILVLAVLPRPEVLPMQFAWQDKVEHVGVFLVLALVAMQVLRVRIGTVVIGLAAYGAAMELAQSFAPARFASFGDLAADLVGLALAVLVAQGLNARCAPPRA